MSQYRKPILGDDRQLLEAGHIVYPHKGLSDPICHFLMGGRADHTFLMTFGRSVGAPQFHFLVGCLWRVVE